MDEADIIRTLEQHWSRPEGFFAKLREGTFDPAAFEQLENTLKSLDFTGVDVLSKRMVSLLWFMPLFMTWQRERVGDRVTYLDAAITSVENLLEKILGVP